MKKALIMLLSVFSISGIGYSQNVNIYGENMLNGSVLNITSPKAEQRIEGLMSNMKLNFSKYTCYEVILFKSVSCPSGGEFDAATNKCEAEPIPLY